MNSSYTHSFYNTDLSVSSIPDIPVGKVVCVGRNYLDHIQELDNTVSETPILFLKPQTAFCDLRNNIEIPKHLGECHNELELALLITEPLLASVSTAYTNEQLADSIGGIGLALDLTLRDLQKELKAKGHPWERAKSFDKSCPISPFIPLRHFNNTEPYKFSLTVNNELRQYGDTSLMLYSVIDLLREISSVFSLTPGDVVLTGTPKGVAALASTDILELSLKGHFDIKTQVD
ncbi:fumarylacetoacetate hydrolase family protein [Glaciecola sp. MH2013]|uniref:fumarylacetoacetate hydrolase family protein n=1 Tax=Glaciecola sp. MH2013 TaxID=2785524 RepID=UPI0018A11543|nr:fumarylacetoacetate hydrolase family protein [Glaciecola sp. MH2013]MBF7072508.1 fumarylacetoacetate hydrolase family protein [Glaciecola sp. MH2013]